MPRVKDKRTIDDLQHDVELPREEPREEKIAPEEKKRRDRHYAVLYLVVAVLVFGLGLLVIALVNLGVDGRFYI